ncbi:MAG: hypothetical protein IJ955_00075 [Oscillospiraceae bacterium]|nr:hypothetical protein [Oscillospiraceae bacterium]
MPDILKRDGLSTEILRSLSYQSVLGVNLKSNLHYFDKQALFAELEAVNAWYNETDMLDGVALDYRIKSLQSAMAKYERYYPDHQARKVFDDLLGFRSLCDNYDGILDLQSVDHFRVADMSNGKAHDDGYRGIHVYFQLSGTHYPIEIQYNTYFDRQLNNWLHKYVYKKPYAHSVGCILRQRYECGKITSENDFKEVLDDVLSCSETC